MLRGKALFASIVLIYAFLLAPLVAVLAVSISSREQFTITWLEPTLKWYQAFFTSHSFFNSLFYVSLPMAIIAATIATLLGAGAAVAITLSMVRADADVIRTGYRDDVINMICHVGKRRKANGAVHKDAVLALVILACVVQQRPNR